MASRRSDGHGIKKVIANQKHSKNRKKVRKQIDRELRATKREASEKRIADARAAL